MLFRRNFVFSAFVVGLFAAGIDVGRSSTQAKIVNSELNCTGYMSFRKQFEE
jgi:hypothetical protein